MPGQQWKGNTYGNGWMHRWLVKMLRIIDVRILYAFVSIFVIPVVLVVNSASRSTIYRYFRSRHHRGRLASAWLTYCNHCMMGQMVIDRFAMYAGRRFKVDVEGYDHFLSLAGKPDGFVQLSAHIGNYEIAGYTLVAERKVFNALVFAGEKATVMENRNRMFAHTNIRMISIMPDMSHLFAIDAALANGETVSIPADRVNGSPRTVVHSLLGADAKFPLGPFRIVAARSLDVLAVNVMKTGLRNYTIFVEPLHYDKDATSTVKTAQIADAYVAALEDKIRRFPTQWFNYFDFWQQ